MTLSVHDIVRATSAKKAGNGFLGRCPAHDDAHASLSIGAGDRVPVVLSCKAGCSFASIEAALGFEKGELTRPESHAGVTSSEFSRRRENLIATYTYRNINGSIFAQKERFIDDVGSKTFRWSRPDGDRWLAGTRGEIPLYRLPELIGAPIDELVLIVEGEKDADRLAGLAFVVTTSPNGAASKWRESDSQYFVGRRVCVIGDDDEPGRKKMFDTASALRSLATVSTLTLPNPQRIKGFDASDFLGAGGTVAELKAAIENSFAPRLAPEIVTPDALAERVLRLYDVGDEPGVFPGWDKLRRLYRPRRGEMTVVSGAPNAGKSTFLDDLAVRIACGDQSPAGKRCAGWRWMYYSAEQFPPERHASKLLQKIIGKPFGEGPTPRMTREEIAIGMKLLGKHFTIVDPSFTGCTLDRILEIAHEHNSTHGIEGLILDPYNAIAATSRVKQQSEHEFVNEMLAKLRTFAQSERVHVIVVAHPTKLRREQDETEYPIPRPWDISGSAHWYNHADAILCVWRALKDEARVASGEVEIHVQKIRFQPECGQLGMARLFFDRVTSRFLEDASTRLAPWEAA